MRSMTNQFADCCLAHRAMRAPGIGVASLILLIGALGGCGGAGSNGGAESDPEANRERSMESWQAELATTRTQMAAMPQEAYWPYRLAEIQVAMDSTAVALLSLKGALALDPDYTSALLLLSKLQYESARYEEAVILLEDALSRDPQDADALRMALAIHLEALGEMDRAQAHLDLCAQDPTTRRGVETFLSLRGDSYLESLSIAEEALQADPQSASNHNNYGIALLYDGQPEAAHASFMRALEVDPELAGALYNLAIVETYYFYDLEKGRAWFERYALLESEDPDELGAVFGVDLAARQAESISHAVNPQGTHEEERNAK